MSQAESSTSPYPRDDFWGAASEHSPASRGHEETSGTDPAKYIAFRELLALTQPVCERTQRELGIDQPLTDPELYLPKQNEQSTHTVEYRQHRHRRRWNPETGYINWGESTATAVPSVDEEIYRLAVHNYLGERGVRAANVDQWLEYAGRLWHDPQLSAVDALTTLVEKVRAYDNPQNRRVTEVPE